MSNLHIHSILQDVSLWYFGGYLITQGYKYSVNQRGKIIVQWRSIIRKHSA